MVLMARPAHLIVGLRWLKDFGEYGSGDRGTGETGAA